MKNLINLMLLSFVCFLTSCDKDETIDSLKNQTLTFDEFFEKVSNMDLQTSADNSIHVNYTWNKQNNTITIIDSEEKEISWGVAMELASLKTDKEYNKSNSAKGEKYKVSCDNGAKSWNKTCSGVRSCGGLINDCLQAGGCAEICQLKLEYYDSENIFFLSSDTSVEEELIP